MTAISSPSTPPKPAPPKVLKAVVVMDYQNVHLVGRKRFRPHSEPTHLSVIHPLVYANRLIDKRNARQRVGFSKARLSKVHVFRGQPDSTFDPIGYGASLAQTEAWEKSNPDVVHITNRALTYEYVRDATGSKIRDIHGNFIQKPGSKPSEKGVDVLCALAAYRAAQEEDVDLVILASIDSDLVPVLHAIQESRAAKVETACWGDRRYGPYGELRTDPGYPDIWTTHLDREDFEAVVDSTVYLP